MSRIPEWHGSRLNYLDSLHMEPWNQLGQGSPYNTMPSLYSDQLRSCFPSSSPSSQIGLFEYKSIDWKETPHAHVFKADVPGMRKEEVNVEVEDDRFLQISGQRKMEIEDRGDTWHQIERSSGKFMRRIRLPANANVGQVKAYMENGVLTVTVLKEVMKKRYVKQIEISSG